MPTPSPIMDPRIGATSGMNTRRPSSPMTAVPIPTAMMALSSGMTAAAMRRRNTSRTTTAASSPSPSLDDELPCDSSWPMDPPTATSQSGADSLAVSRTSCAVAFSWSWASETCTFRMAVFLSSDSRSDCCLGPLTARTPVTSSRLLRVVLTSSAPDPVDRSVWQPMTTGWAPDEAPVKARASSV